jgi:hypothetical protein
LFQTEVRLHGQNALAQNKILQSQEVPHHPEQLHGPSSHGKAQPRLPDSGTGNQKVKNLIPKAILPVARSAQRILKRASPYLQTLQHIRTGLSQQRATVRIEGPSGVDTFQVHDPAGLGKVI